LRFPEGNGIKIADDVRLSWMELLNKLASATTNSNLPKTELTALSFKNTVHPDKIDQQKELFIGADQHIHLRFG
jgi:hypothetical protein